MTSFSSRSTRRTTSSAAIVHRPDPHSPPGGSNIRSGSDIGPNPPVNDTHVTLRAAAVLTAVASFALAACSSSGRPISQPVTSSSSSAPPSTSTTLAGQLLSVSGKGTLSTGAFTVPASAPGWMVDSSFDCGSSPEAGWVNVHVYSPANNQPDMADPELAAKIGHSGTASTEYHDAGAHYLTITGPCPWTVTARLAPPAGASTTAAAAAPTTITTGPVARASVATPTTQAVTTTTVSNKVAMPNVVGERLSAAAAELKADRIGFSSYCSSGSSAPPYDGTVTAQRPPPGTMVTPNSDDALLTVGDCQSTNSTSSSTTAPPPPSPPPTQYGGG